ncbi:MAG: hypothetical protein E7559_02680 [Ruminococcaceae bacterium]|nr:hypothetical protein [Oscillospiraceae bacterium]
METMIHILPDQMADNSSSEEFRFSIGCAECGQPVHSLPVRFSKAGVLPPTDGKQVVYTALYEREKENARRLAVKSIGEHLSLCPICGRLVCDRCFLVCEDLDMCAACAMRLQEEGEPVISPALSESPHNPDHGDQ